MASKRIETVKSHNQGGVVSITQNVDPAISIQELIKTGLEHYRTGKTGQFTKNSSSKQPPPTFNVKPSPKSSRNNSLGRKPHESGSDDSFVDSGAGGSVGGSSRPTHSPASVSGFHPYPQPPRIEHHKMTSDPGFYHTMPDYHASAPGPASGPVPGQTAPRYTAGLPPVPHGRTSHGSAHSVATSPHQVMQSPQPAPMMQPFHQQSRSLEVMTAAHSHDALAYDSSVPTVAGAPAGYYPDNKPSSHQTGGGAGGWHQRTVSLDPMIMASHSSGIASPHANDSTGSAHSLGQYSAAAAADSSYGPLPEGWSTGLDPSGTLYFIDHNTKKTTWLDPRLPSKHQEQMLKSRMQQYPHQRQASTPQLQQPQYYPQQPPQVAPTTNPPAPYVQGSQTADYAYSDASHRNKMNQLSMETKYMHERQKELYEIGLLQPQQMSSQYSSSSMGPPNVQHQQQQQQQHGYGTGGGYGTSSSGFNMQQQPSSVDAMEVDYAQIPQNHGGYGGQHHHAPHNAYQPSVRQEFFQDINPQEFERYLYIEQK